MKSATFTLLTFLALTLSACSPPAATETPAPDATVGAETPTTEAPPAGPDVVGEEVTYQGGGITMKGYLAYDRSQTGPRPGIVVVHEWWGHNDYVRERARMLAALGYTALAIDMYGDGRNTNHPADAQTFMQAAIADRDAAAERFLAGLALLKAHPTTDPKRTAAIGYCFGGAVALHMARAGADLDAVVSFHGNLSTPTPAKPGDVTAQVLVLTGAADQMVPPAQVEAFEREMREAGARFEVVRYEGAMHAFTNPGATAIGEQYKIPLAYNEAADKDSWQRMQTLFKTVFSAPDPTPEQLAKLKAEEKTRGELAKLVDEAEQERARFTPELRAKAKQLAETAFKSTAAALKTILKSPHRKPGNPERDVYRHPDKTLAFFGIKPTMTVFEYGPGEGWYTELLAPLLSAKGKLIVNNGDPNGPPEARGTYYAKRTQLFLDTSPELYGKVEVVRVDDIKKPELGEGTLDAALIIRGYHGWVNNGAQGAWLAALHKALRPKGILGIVQHRAAPDTPVEQAAKQGRVPQAALIAEVEAAGFKLVGKSEINKNPKDPHEQPAGVWTLPPTLRLGDQDRDKYLSIGESDRMTLKFVKVGN